MRRHRPVAGLGFALLLSACGGSPPAAPGTSAPSGTPAPRTAGVTPAKPSTGQPQPPAAAGADEEKALPSASSEPGYDPKGRRDPFEVPEAVEGSAGTSVASARLTGIVRSQGGRVLALIETPDGLGYILQPGDTFGDGRLIEVGPDTVVFTVAARRGSTDYRVMLQLGGE